MLSAVKTGGAVRRMAPVMQGTFKTALPSGQDQGSISLDAGYVGILVGPGPWAGSGRASGMGLRHAPQDRGNSW